VAEGSTCHGYSRNVPRTRQPYEPPRPRKSPDEGMFDFLLGFDVPPFTDAGLDGLTPARLPEFIAMLRNAESDARVLRRRLESRLMPTRSCQVCGRRVSGRAGKTYCGSRCRQQGYRLRQGPKASYQSAEALGCLPAR
jgi:hypothetical protein